MLKTVLARLEDMKAEDSIVIDLTGKSSIGDYMVVTSGRSQRHVSAVADVPSEPALDCFASLATTD